jgi:hypothetical protein
MKCDELRERAETGALLGPDAWEHMESCARCREEFAHLRALRTNAPVPPPGLRDRVLEAAFPGSVGRGFRWQTAAAAAAVALAFTGGILLGRDVERKTVASVEPTVVERIVVKEVEKKAQPDDKDLFLLALALERVYKQKVKIDYDGVKCELITADESVLQMVPYCPIAQKLEIALKERPDRVRLRK